MSLMSGKDMRPA